MKKMKLDVYDPPMCCSSGVCSPNINTALVEFSSDLEWLKTQNVEVERYDLINHPEAFANQEAVNKTLLEEGNKCLPILLVNGAIVSKGFYPSRDVLAGFLGIRLDDVNLLTGNKGTGSEKPNQEPSNPQEEVIGENMPVCGPGCGCQKPSGSSKVKVVVFLLVILAICITLAYKANSEKQNAPVNTGAAFASPIANEIDKPDSTSNSAITAPSDTTALSETIKDKQDLAVVSDDKPNPENKSVEDNNKIGEILDLLSSLNKVALNQDTVFIYVPVMGKETIKNETAKVIRSVEKQLKSKRIRLGVYTLKTSSSDYSKIKAQLPLPGILVLTKGRGSGTVSGDITEAKLLQAYVASTQGGGCCPSTGGKSSKSSSGCK